jgi:cytochrome c biogenesis protein CcmG/thiol:disulfide interchange protein DsbE
MSDLDPPADSAGRLEGKGCLIVGLLGIVAVFVSMAAVAVVGSILFRPAPKEIGEGDHSAVGRQLPHLEFQPLRAGDPPVTTDQLRGKVVAIDLWATWCPPCREELPHLAELGKSLRDRPDFRLLAVSHGVNVPEDPETLRRDTQAFLTLLGVDIPAYVDPDGATLRALQSIGRFEGLPAMILVDRKGTIRGVWEGFNPEVPKQIDEMARRLLEEEPPVFTGDAQKSGTSG